MCACACACVACVLGACKSVESGGRGAIGRPPKTTAAAGASTHLCTPPSAALSSHAAATLEKATTGPTFLAGSSSVAADPEARSKRRPSWLLSTTRRYFAASDMASTQRSRSSSCCCCTTRRTCSSVVASDASLLPLSLVSFSSPHCCGAGAADSFGADDRMTPSSTAARAQAASVRASSCFVSYTTSSSCRCLSSTRASHAVAIASPRAARRSAREKSCALVERRWVC